mmetsp:Transcript_27968/g.64546  ORF Transcript_27968/g.64546 Transcript_27968/m.64546 type:complete len:223 (+) Transcript_27968:103-771(+)
MSGRGKKSVPPQQIGWHGKHDHGKPLDDPVYPTKKVPLDLLPSFPYDWRSAGRALLCMAMSALEGRRLRSRGAVFRWQRIGPCGAICGEQCVKSRYRIMCAWRVPGTVHEHHNRMDDLLLSYKGVVHYESNTKPIFRVRRRVALRNRFKAERMVWEASSSKYIYADREDIDPAFGIRPDRDNEHYEEGVADYDSASDPEASSADEDSDGDGCAFGPRGITVE